MRTGFQVLVVCSIFAFPGSSQTATRTWKDRAEYDLATRITTESDASVKIKLLLEWRLSYPESDFAGERQLWLLRAYDAAGRGDDAFSEASKMLQRDPRDATAMLVLCTWAPRLKAPPDGAAALVRKAATDLLNRLDEVLPASRTRRAMSSLFDNIETGQPARTEQTPDASRQEQRAKVEATARQALDWANAR